MEADAPNDEGLPPAPQKETRVDRAHARADEKPGEPAADVRPLAPVLAVEFTPEVTSSQIRLQASQLAAQLQKQQATLDHREAELNARVASMENQIRAARLWLDERQAEIADREAELTRREQRLQKHSGETASGEPSSTAGDVDHRTAELDRREAELAAAAERFGRRFGSADDTAGSSASLESYRENLERSEKLLAEQQADWQKKFRELAEQRAVFTRFVETERSKLAEERRKATTTLDEQHRELRRQQTELSSRIAALETLRADVARSQQETLEMRLATEELWSQLCGQHEPASLAQSLGKIRLKLADEFSLAKSELASERAEIKELGERVAQQYQKTVSHRTETQSWLNARLRELEQYAGRLTARERQLDEQRVAIQAERAQWHSERFRLEQEIRQLLRQAPGPRNASAA